MTPIQLAWVSTAGAFTLLLVPCAWVAFRRGTMNGVVALELAGAVTTLALVCLAVGFQRSSYASLPIVAAVMTAVSGLVFVRFLGDSDEHR